MRRVVFAAMATVVGLVLLLTFKTQSATAPAQASGVTGSTSSGTSSATGAGSSGSGSDSDTSSGTSSSTTSGTKTVTGTAADTRYGPVQVQITVVNGKITAAQAIDYPQNDPRDQQINSYAVPELNSEAVSAGSASIDTVSGATYTSDGYKQSLQSALDQL